MRKGIKWSDAIGGRLNTYAGKMGSEAFWPVTGDFPQQMDKAARILRAFTVDGVETTVTVDKSADPLNGKKQRKVLRKIPPKIIAEAHGLAIFTSMRTGIAPFGGAGGAGVVVAKLDDGTWSAPSSMSPNTLSTGLMLGIDIYDAVLVIRTPQALASFSTHKATLGTDVGVVAGPFGAGAAVEAGKEKAPVFSYVRSRGLYAGVQLVGQVFVDRFEENAAMYAWPGIKAGDILAGKVRVPKEAANLQQALLDAESGRAQRMKGDDLDVVVPLPDDLELRDGEVLKLPPTPTSVGDDEGDSDEEAQRVIHESHRASSHSHLQNIVAPTAVSAGLGYEAVSAAEALEWEQHEQMLKDMERQEEELEKKQREEFEDRLKVDKDEVDEDLEDVTKRLAIAPKDGIQTNDSQDKEMDKPLSSEEEKRQLGEQEKPQLT